MAGSECHIGEDIALMGLTINFTRDYGGTLQLLTRGEPGVFGDTYRWEPLEMGVQPESDLLRLGGNETRAFWDAIDKRRDPPTESKALRDALEIERRRNDQVNDRLFSIVERIAYPEQGER